MNANELADDLDYASTISEPRIQMMGRMRIAATMLRQQAEQIENLKQWERRHLDVIEKQQEQIKDLKQQVAFLEDWRDTWSPFLKASTGKVNDERN